MIYLETRFSGEYGDDFDAYKLTPDEFFTHCEMCEEGAALIQRYNLKEARYWPLGTFMGNGRLATSDLVVSAGGTSWIEGLDRYSDHTHETPTLDRATLHAMAEALKHGVGKGPNWRIEDGNLFATNDVSELDDFIDRMRDILEAA